jgi:hypothetical protein
MTPAFALHRMIPAALSLLPTAMDTPAARALLLAIGLQESKFQHRRQVQGPARGYWQFEEHGGVAGVLDHRVSAPHAWNVCTALDYSPSVVVVYDAIADNDVLACAFARLLLWTLPERLPTRGEPDVAWRQYLDGWRAGKPHRATWNEYYDHAWALVDSMKEQEP